MKSSTVCSVRARSVGGGLPWRWAKPSFGAPSFVLQPPPRFSGPAVLRLVLGQRVAQGTYASEGKGEGPTRSSRTHSQCGSGNNAMKKLVLIILLAAAVAIGCATAPVSADAPSIRVEAGKQLRPWGLEIHSAGAQWKMDGYVSHLPSVRRQLEEHVHIEVAASNGMIVHTAEAQVSIRANHTADAAIPLHATIAAQLIPQGGVIVVRVVRNTSDDRGV